ncbi:calcium-binding protein [Sulfitobacter sabulilitoris]|nr:calcium-binding protein [Sulfitobacter sabulilitoris]
MTSYNEITNSTTPTWDYFSPDGTNPGALDLLVGDTLQGNMGPRGGNDVDTNDRFSINAVEGQTYTFTVTGFASGVDLFAQAVDADGTLISLATHTADDTSGTMTFSFRASATGVLTFDLSAAFAGGVSSTDYTVTLIEVAAAGAPSLGDDDLVGNMTSDRVDLMAGDDVYVALGGSDVVTGGDGNDLIHGVCGNDRLFGDAGNDTLTGGNGNDWLVGGIGNDHLTGDNNDDILDGGDGDDYLSGDKGADTLDGGAGDDTLVGHKDNDVLIGGAGKDVYYVTSDAGQDQILDFEQGADRIDMSGLGFWDFAQLTLTETGDGGVLLSWGGIDTLELTGTALADMDAGDFILDDAPVIAATGSDDTIYGTDYAENIDGGAGNDYISARGGDDNAFGGAGDDKVLGGAGNDMVDGGDGKDRLYGQDGDDLMFGQGGNDVMSGGNGNDTVKGGGSNDRVYGNDGQDALYGDTGNDKLYGGNGDDELFGGSGNDILIGDGGNDILIGGYGRDTIAGGDGADVFVFDSAMSIDTITDFEDGVDKFDVTAFGYDDISQMTISQVGTDVHLGASSTEMVILLNTDIASIDNTDFVQVDDTIFA